MAQYLQDNMSLPENIPSYIAPSKIILYNLLRWPMHTFLNIMSQWNEDTLNWESNDMKLRWQACIKGTARLSSELKKIIWSKGSKLEGHNQSIFADRNDTAVLYLRLQTEDIIFQRCLGIDRYRKTVHAKGCS